MNTNNTIYITSTQTTDTGVILIPKNPLSNLSNLSCYNLIIACNVNTPTANEIVFIQTPNGNAPLLCKYGNNILANMLNKRTRYTVYYGNQNSEYTTTGQFVMPSCRCLNPRGVESTTTTTTSNEGTNINPDINRNVTEPVKK